VLLLHRYTGMLMLVRRSSPELVLQRYARMLLRDSSAELLLLLRDR
jgi:hypothetical protein